MTLSQVSARVGALAAAALVSGTLLFAAPQAHAATGKGAYYQVQLNQAPAASKKVVRGVFFKCEGTTCVAPLASSAPKNVCVSVAREFGEVSSFKAGTREFGAEDLAACNDKAPQNIAKN